VPAQEPDADVSSCFRGLKPELLAELIPELLLCGHLIDRAGMPHAIGAFGREGMGQVAIEEWRAASPVYSRRTLAALGIEHRDVRAIFKCLQHDIGAPPQFLDFRFTVHDEYGGEFTLPHCGALLDVEPMGEEFVVTMCHDIEDPTFDATAAAVNPRARIRPVHRPPRVPADRSPHCHWTVTIDPDRESLPWPDEAADVERSQAARHPLTTDPGGPGESDYSGPLREDMDWSLFTPGLRARIAEEVCLQWHLLSVGFARAVRRRTDEASARALLRRQLVGIGGLTSGRLRDFLGLPASADSVAAVLSVHPVLQPASYTGVSVSGDRIILDRASPAQQDAGWLRLLLDDDLSPLEALVHGVAPTLTVRVEDDAVDRRVVRVVDTGEPRPEPAEVQLVRFSKGADFSFEDRRLLPITPV
jgi:hypothetical protein